MGNQSGCDLHMMQIINDNTCPYCRIAELERDLAEASEAIKLKNIQKGMISKCN